MFADKQPRAFRARRAIIIRQVAVTSLVLLGFAAMTIDAGRRFVQPVAYTGPAS